jgi:hypothetical protein
LEERGQQLGVEKRSGNEIRSMKMKDDLQMSSGNGKKIV